MKLSPEKAKISDEAQLRVAVVSEQREIEEKLKSGKAVFVVPSLLTPMFINSKYVRYDESDSLFKLNTDDMSVIPDGLIPEAKMKDPAQLSTVLGRVLSVRGMLDRGIEVTILYHQVDRPKASNSAEHVDSHEIETMKKQYQNLHLKVIEQKRYEDFKTRVCAATFWHDEDGVDNYIGIDASQVNTQTAHHDWGVKRDLGMIDKIEALNELLALCDYKPISTQAFTPTFK